MEELWMNDEDLSWVQNHIDDFELFTFDIFDTLLFRRVSEPKNLFKFILKNCSSKCELYRDTKDVEFEEIRQSAETEARRKKRKACSDELDPEVTLQDIYDEMSISDKDKELLMSSEIDLEKKILFVNPVMYEFIKYIHSKNKKIVLISDMYLSRQMLQDILEFNGFDLKFLDDIFVSSEYKKSKSSGKLYKEVMRKYGIAPKKILHIGDNAESDGRQAELCGLKSCLYSAISKKDVKMDLEKLKYGHILEELYSIRKMVCNLTCKYEKEDKFWFQYGASVLGPFFTLFLDWVVNLAKKNNIKQIRPFMREAYLFEEALKEAASFNGASLDVRPLYVSREATALPAMTEADDELIDNLIKERKNLTVQDVFVSLGIGEFSKSIELAPNRFIKSLNNDEKSYLKSKILDNRDFINKYIMKRKKDFMDYLSQEINLDEKFITVDMGYSGTVQLNIDKILRFYNVPVKAQHAVAIGSKRVIQKLLNGVNITSYASNPNDNNYNLNEIILKVILIEEIILGDIGSTLNYKNAAGKIEPILDENRIPANELRYRAVCKEGILKFQKLFYETKSNNTFKTENCSEDICKVLTRLLTVPTYEEANNLINLHYEANYGSTSLSSYVKEEDFKLLEKYGIEKFLRIAKAKNVIWPEGVVTLKYPKYIISNEFKQSKFKTKYFSQSVELVMWLKDNNLDKNIVVYGAGEVGKSIIDVLSIFDLKADFIIDRKESLSGVIINGVQVISLEEAKGNNCKEKNIIIASFEFANEIEETIQKEIVCNKIINIGNL